MKAQLGSSNQKSSGLVDQAKGNGTNVATKAIPIPGLLGNGLAAVVGLPPDFELVKSLRESCPHQNGDRVRPCEWLEFDQCPHTWLQGYGSHSCGPALFSNRAAAVEQMA